MSVVTFPDSKIPPRPRWQDITARVERDVYSGAADLMLLAKELDTVDQVLAVAKTLHGLRASLDSAASFLLERGEELSNR